MKTFSFFNFLFVGILGIQTTIAQDTATNNTNETWQINYYGEINTINPDPGVPQQLNKGTDCAIGIKARNIDGTCQYTFTMSPQDEEPISDMCSTDTDEITFEGDIDTSPACSASAPPTVFENIEIVFN